MRSLAENSGTTRYIKRLEAVFKIALEQAIPEAKNVYVDSNGAASGYGCFTLNCFKRVHWDAMRCLGVDDFCVTRDGDDVLVEFAIGERYNQEEAEE